MIAPSAARPRLHIALVEDDPLVADSLGDFLGREEYQVHPCPSGAALRALLGRAPVDLILLDLGLPDEDGFALAAQIRAQSPVMREPHNGIFMVTGYDEALEKNLGVMDATAIALARDNKLPIIVFSLDEPGGFRTILAGQGTYTTVQN